MNHVGRRILKLLGGLAVIAGVVGGGALLVSWSPPPTPPVPPSGILAILEARSKALAPVRARAAGADLQRATWDELHGFPASAAASDQACLTCHQEVVSTRPRTQSPAGLQSSSALAWYQTLDTYAGEQETFHFRHLSSPFARQVMNLGCTFCHQANDPREESPHARRASAPAADAPQPFHPPFDLRRTVNTRETCLRCHGAFPGQVMGLSEPWHALREGLETAETPNGCLTCHAETFRTTRHRVSYLHAANIEQAARSSSDVCFGCHGGRAWYRISFPYPRNPWPDMPEETPDWAQDRPRRSDPRFALPQR